MSGGEPKPGILPLLRMARPVAWRLAIACLLAVAGTTAGIGALVLIAAIIAGAAAGQSAEFGGLALGAAIALLVQGPLMGLSTGIAHNASFDLLIGLRRRLLRHLARMPLGELTARRIGSLRRVLNEEVEAIELFTSHQLPDVVGSASGVLMLAAALLWADWRLGLAALAVLPLATAAQAIMMRGHGEKIATYFGRIGRVNGTAVELVQGLSTLRTLPGAGRITEQMRGEIRDLLAFSEAWRREWMPAWVLYTVVIGASPLFVLPLGLWLHAAGGVGTGTLVFCLLAATGFGMPLLRLAVYTEILLRVQKAETKIRALLEAPLAPCPAEPAPPPQGGDIVFEGVGLTLGGHRILDAVDLCIPQGGITAIVGPSGAGKTSLGRLIGRALDPTEGRISIGGTDLAACDPAAVACLVAVVDQDVFLFNDTVRENIRLGRAGATDEEIEAAARAAHCTGFIAGLPQGFDTPLGEGGARLSGGQRQRIALARAILARSPILLLDEATSSNDALHEILLQDAIGRLAGECSIIVISHRLDSVAGCDRIALMEAGQVVACGTHDALLATAPRYAALWRLQQENLAWGIPAGTAPALPEEASP